MSMVDGAPGPGDVAGGNAAARGLPGPPVCGDAGGPKPCAATAAA